MISTDFKGSVEIVFSGGSCVFIGIIIYIFLFLIIFHLFNTPTSFPFLVVVCCRVYTTPLDFNEIIKKSA
jgi:hypothetical protein